MIELNIINSFEFVFLRDLTKVKEELSRYKNNEIIWETPSDITNSTGQLVQHLIGNLQHFIGAVLGKNGYIRNRENEFRKTMVSIETLKAQLEEVAYMVKAVLGELKEESLAEKYPIKWANKEVTIGFLLIQLSVHLNYHLGQINYHRRLIDN